MNVVDALVVTLGLDASKFTSGSKQATADLKRTKEDANAAAKQIEASGKQAAEFFKRLRNEAIALFATFTAGRGIADFIRDITASDAATGRLAHNLGISTNELSAWEKAAESVGGTAGATAGSFDSFTQELQRFALTGQSDIIPWLRALNLSIVDSHGNLLPVTTDFENLSKALQGMDPRRALAFGRALHLDDGTIRLLELGPEALRKLLAEKAKVSPTDADAGRAQGLLAQIQDIRQQIEQLVRTVLNNLSPAISELLKQFDDWLKKDMPGLARSMSDELQKFVGWLKSIDWAAVSKGLADFRDGTTGVITHLGGWIRVTETLFALWVGSKFLAVLANMRLAMGATALGGLGAGLMRLLGVLALTATLSGDTPGGDPEKEKQNRERWNKEHGFKGDANGYVNFWDWLREQMFGSSGTTLSSWLMGAIGMGIGAAPRSPNTRMLPRTPLGASPAAYVTPAPSTGATTPLSGLGAPLGMLGRSGDARAAGIRDQLARDLGLTREQAAGIVSNLQAESGLQGINERHPTVPGSRGGFGWAQWTGPRRLAFEAWAAQHHLDPKSDAANYGFLVHELRTQYGATLQGVRGSRSAREAAARFFRGYESGGAAGLERWLSAHQAHADRFAALPSPGRLATDIKQGGAKLAMHAKGGVSHHDNRSNSEVHVNGPINVSTQATDARGVARGLGGALKDHMIFASQANYALA